MSDANEIASQFLVMVDEDFFIKMKVKEKIDAYLNDFQNARRSPTTYKIQDRIVKGFKSNSLDKNPHFIKSVRAFVSDEIDSRLQDPYDGFRGELDVLPSETSEFSRKVRKSVINRIQEEMTRRMKLVQF